MIYTHLSPIILGHQSESKRFFMSMHTHFSTNVATNVFLLLLLVLLLLLLLLLLLGQVREMDRVLSDDIARLLEQCTTSGACPAPPSPATASAAATRD
jgi:hypothetical protein